MANQKVDAILQDEFELFINNNEGRRGRPMKYDQEYAMLVDIVGTRRTRNFSSEDPTYIRNLRNAIDSRMRRDVGSTTVPFFKTRVVQSGGRHILNVQSA